MKLFDTPPIAILDLPADSQHSGKPRPTATIRYIIIHTTEGVDSREWLSTSPHSDVSCHRLIQRTPYNETTKMGGHYKIVPDDVVAYHAGFGTINRYSASAPLNVNDVSLGIELERYGNQRITAYQYQQTALQIREWWGAYGLLPVLSHQDVDPKRRSDPVNFDWQQFWRTLWASLQSLTIV